MERKPMRTITLAAVTASLLLAFASQAEEKKYMKNGKAHDVITKEKQYIPSGQYLEFDIAPPDQKWEFAEEEWCHYAAKMGMKLLRESDLDLSKYNWGFTEEYAHTPERLMGGRDVAGYFIMLKDGKLSGGAGIPQECLDLPGFHINVEWGLIAHPSAFFYGSNGGGRGKASAQLNRDLEAAGKGADKSTKRKPKVNTDGPTWPPGILVAIMAGAEQGGGLHNYTAQHLYSSPEVKDLPQTDWGVAILTKMTDKQKEDFYKLIGR